MSSDVRRESAIDMGRLFRGSRRAIQQLGPRQYAVQGTKERTYFVDLAQEWPCDCADAAYRGRGCLHELAARLQERDPALMLVLGEALLKNQKIMAQLTGEAPSDEAE